MAIFLPPLLDYVVVDSVNKKDGLCCEPMSSHNANIANLARAYLKGRSLTIYSAALLGPVKPAPQDISVNPRWISYQPRSMALRSEPPTSSTQKPQFRPLSLKVGARRKAVTSQWGQKRKPINRDSINSRLNEAVAFPPEDLEEEQCTSGSSAAKRPKYRHYIDRLKRKGRQRNQMLELDRPLKEFQITVPLSHNNRRVCTKDSLMVSTNSAVGGDLLSMSLQNLPSAHQALSKFEEQVPLSFPAGKSTIERDIDSKLESSSFGSRYLFAEVDSCRLGQDACSSDLLSNQTALTDAHSAFQKCLESHSAAPSNIKLHRTFEACGSQLLEPISSSLSSVPQAQEPKLVGNRAVSAGELYNAAPEISSHETTPETEILPPKPQVKGYRGKSNCGDRALSPSETPTRLGSDSARIDMISVFKCAPQAALEPQTMETVLHNADSFLGSWSKEMAVGSMS